MNPFNSFLNSAYNYIKISVVKGFKNIRIGLTGFVMLKKPFVLIP